MNKIHEVLMENKMILRSTGKAPGATSLVGMENFIYEKYKGKMSADYIFKLARNQFEPGVYTALMIADALGRPVTDVFMLEA